MTTGRINQVTTNKNHQKETLEAEKQKWSRMALLPWVPPIQISNWLISTLNLTDSLIKRTLKWPKSDQTSISICFRYTNLIEKKINRHCSAQNVLNNIHQPPTHCHSKSFPPSCYDQVHYLAKDKVWRRFWLNVHPKEWDYWINRSLQVGFPSVLLANGHFLPGSPNIAQSTPKRCKSRLIEASAINLLPNWPQLFPCMVCVPFQTWSSITRSQTRLIEMRIHVIQS